MPGRFGAQCNRSTLSIVNHCHPSEATRLALQAANPLCSLFQPSVGQAGNLIKRSCSWGLRGSGGGGREGRNEVLLVCVWWCWGGRCGGQGHSRAINPDMGLRVRDGGLERVGTALSLGQRWPSVCPSLYPSIHPSSSPPPPPLPTTTTTCPPATTSVPREMSATEKKAHKGLTFHMAGSPRLKRPDNPRRLD